MVKQTSLLAYKELIDSGELGKNQKKVLDCITEYNGISDLQIAKIIDFQINQVTGRRNELLKKGLIESHCKIKSPITGRLVHLWVRT